uniref:Uncharacterized protein n=1 Tax=viral metagenome TaxID=1070528 RepID=A0A6C0JJN2_9ZZZZ
MDADNLEEPVVENVVVEPPIVIDETFVEPPIVIDETFVEPTILIDTSIPKSFIENNIDPAISESFIKELFIEMVDIKSPVVEESPIVENPILDEIDISNENQLQVVIQISNVDTSVHDTSLHDTSINGTHLENTIETKKGIDQDTLQRLSVGVQVCLELYRVITSSLLILFVPQICEDHICTTTENLVWETNTYNTALCFNFISMACLVNMYYMELVRENRMIKYLAVNPELANDNDGVGEQLELLSMNKQNKIFSINRYYRLSSYGAASIYLLNVLLSAVAVNKYYAGSQTVSTFVTYVLFMATKFASVHSLVSTEKNIFYSAYLIGKIQYNDVDNDNKITK